MDFIAQYNLTGLVIGLATFLIIGVFHPLVIKGEYHFGVRIWWAFLLMGLAAIAASVAVRHVVWSTLLAVWGASSLWSIGELFEQRKRVAKRVVSAQSPQKAVAGRPPCGTHNMAAYYKIKWGSIAGRGPGRAGCQRASSESVSRRKVR